MVPEVSGQVVRRLYLCSSLKERVKTSNYSPAKRFSEIHSPLCEASDFAVYMLIVSNHTLLAGWLGLTAIQDVKYQLLNFPWGNFLYIAGNSNNQRVSGYIMTTLKFITAFLLSTLYSCGQKPAKYKPDPVAVQLNNQAMTLVAYIENPDSSRKAISLLDKATTIDSNYFLGYSNKLMFFYQLKQFDKAILTNNKLIQLRPDAHDLYMTGGMLYEQIGDTVSSKTHFTKSFTICNAVLDTMNRKNRDFVMLTTNQAINLIMLNDSANANKILEDLYESQPNDPEFDNVEKKYIKSLMNKNKRDLIDFMNNPHK